jgi:hypothetical protein
VSETRSGYKQSVNGLVGAIAMTMVLIAAIWLLSRFHDSQTFTPTAPIDYSQALHDARGALDVDVLAPDHVPAGWRATSATFSTAGPAPVWHLGFLTGPGDDAEYVGLDQSSENAVDFREATTRADQPGATVTIARHQWQLWTSSDGDESAYVRTDLEGTTTVVSGTATKSVLITFVASLTAGSTAAK